MTAVCPLEEFRPVRRPCLPIALRRNRNLEAVAHLPQSIGALIFIRHALITHLPVTSRP